MQEGRSAVYWLLPVAFVVHDAEELFTMPAWFAAHEQQLRSALTRIGVGDYADFVPTTFAEASVAIAIFLAIFLVVTAGAWLHPGSPVWRTLYGGLLGVFLLHTLGHIALALAFHAYTPGLVTALAVVVPASIYIGASLLRRGALDPGASAIAALVGLILFPPGILVAFRFSHWLLASPF